MGLRDKFEEIRRRNAQQAPRPSSPAPNVSPPSNAPSPSTADRAESDNSTQNVKTSQNLSTSGNWPRINLPVDERLAPGNPRSTYQNITLSELALQRITQESEAYNLEDRLQPSVVPGQPADPVAPQPPARPVTGMEGQVINGIYEIEHLLAQGGMGQVFLAKHLMRDNMPVVLKLLLNNADPKSVPYQRMVQEMILTGRMNHPNLVKVYDYGLLIDGLKPYLVMEFVEGLPLRKIMSRLKRLEPAQIARILIQVCCGLQVVHAQNVVHRDLKPENLMVGSDDTRLDNVKILDFGIAFLSSDSKFNEKGIAVGSIGYMSPEQICAQPVDLRTDIYALGVIFYEALTGRPPFLGSTKQEAMELHVKAPHMPPSMIVPMPQREIVDRIADRTLAKRADQRYSSADELAADLKLLVNARY